MRTVGTSAADVPASERVFRAMGTDCRVLGYGPHADALVDLAVQRVAILEHCWSRFRPDSELNRLNTRAGQGPVAVSADLALLVDAMQRAWQWTNGRFDPTVLAAVRSVGYDADFAEVIGRSAVAGSVAVPAIGMAGVDVVDGQVVLPTGVGLDPGAIGKGLAGDVIVDELLGAGAEGILVDLGGDIVFGGVPGDSTYWQIEVIDERDASVCSSVTWPTPVPKAAVATSSALRRRWADGRHHVIDPSTGTVASVEVVQSTVVADSGWRAEVAATAAMLMGVTDGTRWLREQRLSGLLLTASDAFPVRRDEVCHV